MIAEVTQAIGVINNALPSLIGLKMQDRQRLPKIDVTNKVFVDDAIAAATATPDILPAYFRVADVQQDKTGYDLLDGPVLLLSQLAQKVADTQMLMGSEAYVSALTIYRLFESAARDGVPGARAVYEQLAERFKGQGQTADAGGTPPVTG